MKLLVSVLALGILSITASADLSQVDSSKRIAKAVQAIMPLAQSGVTTYRVKPGKSVKEMLRELAFKEGRADSNKEFENSWQGSSGDAWETDSGSFGEATMSDAYGYIMNGEQEYEESLTPKERARYHRDLLSAKEGFKLFMKTGVLFGVVPLGAVQCGVTFQALAIIDPYTGKIYVFAKEGSGC